MPYQVVARLGRGGTGVVELATGPDGRPVALKRVPLHGDPAAVARARRRVRREAEALAAVDHPAVLGLLDVVDDGDDVVLVLPHLAGGSLADRVGATGALAPGEALALAHRLLGGLAAAHRRGVVHRDVTPANVLLAAGPGATLHGGGGAVLADFGVATLADATAGLTAAGELVGTPAYVAPEQAAGDPVGPPADVFGLGATLRWALAGEGPYGSGPPHVLFHRAAAGRVAPPPRGLPAEMHDLLRAMLDPDPARRPSAAELLAALDGAPAGGGGTVVGPPLGRGRSRWRRPLGRRRLVALGAGGAAGLAVALAGVAFALGGFGDPSAGPGAPEPAPCAPLPYQPCGAPVAPHTDGSRCVDDHDDYDGDAANGCEAAPDAVDGTPLGAEPLAATLVPAGDVDRYPLEVDDRAQLLCDGTVRVTLTAPAGAAQRVEVRRGGELLGEAGSTDGLPATVALRDPACGRDDGGQLEVVVRPVGSGRTADAYRLEARGSW